MHLQQKLEQELQQLHEKFEAKKRHIQDTEQAFQDNVKKYTFPAVDDKKFQVMVEEASKSLLAKYQRYLDRQNPAEPEVPPPKEEIESKTEEISTEPMTEPPPAKEEVVSSAEETKSE